MACWIASDAEVLSSRMFNLGRCLRDAGALFAAERRGRLKGWADGYASRAGHEADIRAGHGR